LAFDTMRWHGRQLEILDQTLLPGTCQYIVLDTVSAVFEAIQKLRVRGAPAIGCCAAFGVVVGVLEARPASANEAVESAVKSAARLAESRPTAVNLFWALRKMEAIAHGAAGLESAEDVIGALETAAKAIHDDERELCRLIGVHGSPLISDGAGIMTHCNAGALATSGYGTALSPIFAAHAQGVALRVFANETRPLLQGARLTTWELMQAGVDVTLICDNTAARVMAEGKITMVIVGSDRIAANGDAANKIGTYGVALLAQAHHIPFYVAAPLSTFDLEVPDGDAIPIEERAPEEVTEGFGRRTAPEGVQVYSPAFDVTPAALIAGIITEHGILSPPYGPAIAQAAKKV